MPRLRHLLPSFQKRNIMRCGSRYRSCCRLANHKTCMCEIIIFYHCDVNTVISPARIKYTKSWTMWWWWLFFVYLFFIYCHCQHYYNADHFTTNSCRIWIWADNELTTCTYNSYVHLQGAALKYPKQKPRYLRNSWIFLCQILFASSASYWPQVQCFTLYLLKKINIRRTDGNASFINEFCNWTCIDKPDRSASWMVVLR